MKKLSLLAAAFCVASAPITLSSVAAAHPHEHHHHYQKKRKQRVAYPGQDIDGYRIPNYVFVYADLNNDGVLRGREVRRARDRVIWESRGNRPH